MNWLNVQLEVLIARLRVLIGVIWIGFFMCVQLAVLIVLGPSLAYICLLSSYNIVDGQIDALDNIWQCVQNMYYYNIQSMDGTCGVTSALIGIEPCEHKRHLFRSDQLSWGLVEPKCMKDGTQAQDEQDVGRVHASVICGCIWWCGRWWWTWDHSSSSCKGLSSNKKSKLKWDRSAVGRLMFSMDHGWHFGVVAAV